jgi:hypothetical protein
MLSTKRSRRWKRWNAIAQRVPGVRLRHVVLGCRFAAALLSRYWVQPSNRNTLPTKGRTRTVAAGASVEKSRRKLSAA